MLSLLRGLLELTPPPPPNAGFCFCFCYRDCLGRFPEKAARERFLERMRMYMIGGGTVLSLPDSPHAMGHVRRDSTSSLEDGRDFGQRQHQQQLQVR